VNGGTQKDEQGEEEEEEEEEVLPPLERKASDPVAASHLFALAEVARRKGNADEAQRLYRLCIEAVQAAEAGTVEDDTVASLDSAAVATGLGEALLATKHVSHAALQLEHAYDVRTQAGATKLEVAPLLLSLASALRQSRDVPGAVAACKVAFEAYRDEHGHGNVRTIGARGAYVECLSASGRVEEAMAVCVEAVEALDKEACELEAKQGSEASMSPELKTARHSLGVALMALGELQLRHAPPEKVIETAKESVEAADGGEIEAVKAAQADLRAALEPNDAASQNLSRALFLLDACLGPDAAQSGNAVALLALAHKRCGRLTEALTLTNRLAAASEAALGPTSPAAVTQRLLAAELYSRLDRNAEAVASLTTLVGHSRTIRGEGHLMTADLLATLARFKRAAGDSQGANAALKEAAAAKRKAQENDRGGHSAAYTRMKVAVAAAAAANSTGGQRKATAADLLAAP
jgi:tetratricopeptide (TPR) repeat protein